MELPALPPGAGELEGMEGPPARSYGALVLIGGRKALYPEARPGLERALTERVSKACIFGCPMLSLESSREASPSECASSTTA